MPSRVLVAVIGVGVFLGGDVLAQGGVDVTISAEARPSEVGTEETVTMHLQVEGVPRAAIETPAAPPVTNLEVEDPVPVVGRELSFDEGGLTRRITFEWTYHPIEAGVGRIGPTTVTVRDETFRTDPIRVQIVPQSQRPGTGRSVGPEPFSPRGAPRSQDALAPEALFIRTTASADEVYQGEQVTVEYRLFFRPGIRFRQSRMTDAWEAPGFWREELEVPAQPKPEPTEAFGRTYRTIALKRVALFPTQTGRLEVDPLRIRTEARPEMGRRGNLNPQGQYEPVTLSSQAMSITSHRVPPDAPPSFDGAVGTFALETSLAADSVEVGESVEFIARIEGTGNIAILSPPNVETPTDLAVYEPVAETDLDRGGSVIRGSKTFTYTVVPQANGRYTVPPVTYSYFDPETEQYETLHSAPVTLYATGDVPPQAKSQTGRGLPIGDIAGPIEDPGRWVRTNRSPLHRQPWAYGALLIPVVLAAGGIAYRHYAEMKAASTEELTEGLSSAQDHLREAHGHLREEDRQAFYESIERALLVFLTTRLDLDRTPAGVQREALVQSLATYDLPPEEHEAVQALLNVCHEAQFSPTEPSYASMEAALDHAQVLLIRLDEALPSDSRRSASS